MQYRIRHLPPAAWRIVRQRAGDRLDEGLRRLIELWAAGKIDPLAAQDPIATARGALGGRARAERMTGEERSLAARAAVRARWQRHRS